MCCARTPSICWAKQKSLQNFLFWQVKSRGVDCVARSICWAKHVQTSYSGNSDLGVWINVRPYLLCLRQHLLYARTTVSCNHHTILNQIWDQVFILYTVSRSSHKIREPFMWCAAFAKYCKIWNFLACRLFQQSHGYLMHFLNACNAT
jgi:hypothetical protein